MQRIFGELTTILSIWNGTHRQQKKTRLNPVCSQSPERISSISISYNAMESVWQRCVVHCRWHTNTRALCLSHLAATAHNYTNRTTHTHKKTLANCRQSTQSCAKLARRSSCSNNCISRQTDTRNGELCARVRERERERTVSSSSFVTTHAHIQTGRTRAHRRQTGRQTGQN